MSFGYVLRPRADQDLDEISDYLTEEAGLELGLRFLSEVYETLALLASHRELGWPCKVRRAELPGVRVFRVSERFDKYLIFYRAHSGRIEVLRLLHGAQDLEALFERGGA